MQHRLANKLVQHLWSILFFLLARRPSLGVIIYGDGNKASQNTGRTTPSRRPGHLGNAVPRALDTKSRTAVHTSVMPRRYIPVALRSILVICTSSYVSLVCDIAFTYFWLLLLPVCFRWCWCWCCYCSPQKCPQSLLRSSKHASSAQAPVEG